VPALAPTPGVGSCACPRSARSARCPCVSDAQPVVQHQGNHGGLPLPYQNRRGRPPCLPDVLSLPCAASRPNCTPDAGGRVPPFRLDNPCPSSSGTISTANALRGRIVPYSKEGRWHMSVQRRRRWPLCRGFSRGDLDNVLQVIRILARRASTHRRGRVNRGVRGSIPPLSTVEARCRSPACGLGLRRVGRVPFTRRCTVVEPRK